MLSWGPENPCFDCAVIMPSGEERRAPCCWNVSLELTKEEHDLLFPDKESLFGIIYIVGACPYLNKTNGGCLIENTKPDICQRVEPKRFDLCIKAPNGRYHALFYRNE